MEQWHKLSTSVLVCRNHIMNLVATHSTLGDRRLAVLEVSGRIDQAHAAEFQKQLQPYLDTCTADAAAILLDFSKVEYISSVGLRVLMLAAKQVKTQGGRIGIAALTPIVAEVFQISRFNLVISVYDSVAAGRTELAP
jgi:anti-anti-sigma factor